MEPRERSEGREQEGRERVIRPKQDRHTERIREQKTHYTQKKTVGEMDTKDRER